MEREVKEEIEKKEGDTKMTINIVIEGRKVKTGIQKEEKTDDAIKVGREED